MTHQISLQEAKTKLPELLEESINGDEVVIVKDNEPLVSIITHKKRFKRKIGSARGEVTIKERFKNIPEDFKEYVP